MTNPVFFAFETDFVESLRCIPMIIRMKLDTCGVKLKLEHWNQFNQSEKQTLVEKPCNTKVEADGYRQWLQNLIIDKTGKPAKELAIADNPDWLNSAKIPDSTIAKAAELNLVISLQQWANLSPVQRFALIKLSRPSHENRNFVPALQEFGIISK